MVGSAPLWPSMWDAARAIPILEAAQRLGVELSSRKLQRCPLAGHKDRTPSFSYDRNQNVFYCFGCGAGGSVIEFTAAVRRCTKKKAAHWLVQEDVRRHPDLRAPSPVSSQRLTTSAADPHAYEALLALSPLLPEAKAYLASRAIGASTADQFRVGFVKNAVLLLKQLSDQFGPARLEKAGLLTRGRRLIFRSESLVFPYFDSGAVQYLQARSIGSERLRWVGLSGISKRIYNRDVVATSSSIFICEGVIDVLSAYELGLAAIGLPGAATRLDEKLLQQLRSKSVYIVPDRDDAGTRMANRLVASLRERGIQTVVQQVEGADVNDYLRRRRGLS